jgi:hypothetical protein
VETSIGTDISIYNGNQHMERITVYRTKDPHVHVDPAPLERKLQGTPANKLTYRIFHQTVRVAGTHVRK